VCGSRGMGHMTRLEKTPGEYCSVACRSQSPLVRRARSMACYKHTDTHPQLLAIRAQSPGRSGIH